MKEQRLQLTEMLTDVGQCIVTVFKGGENFLIHFNIFFDWESDGWILPKIVNVRVIVQFAERDAADYSAADTANKTGMVKSRDLNFKYIRQNLLPCL